MTAGREELLVHWRPMVRVCRSVLGSTADAEDCAAGAVAQVLAQQPEGVRNYEAFMVTVAKRRAIDLLRAQDRAGRRDARLAAGQALNAADVAEDIAARAEARWADEQARALLSPQSYRILTLLADGEPAAAIADRLGLTTRAVESHLLRARRTMRAAIAKTLAAIGIGCGLMRRGGMSGPPTVTAAAAAAAVLLVLVPFTDMERAPRPMPPTEAWSSPAPYTGQPAFRPGRESATDPRMIVGSPPSPRPAPARMPMSMPSGPTRITRIEAPAGTSVTVQDRETGGGEDTLAEMVDACLRNFVINAQRIGC